MTTSSVYRRLLGYTLGLLFSEFVRLLTLFGGKRKRRSAGCLLGRLATRGLGSDSLKHWIGLTLGTAPPDQVLVPIAIIAIVLIRGIGTFLGTYYIAFAANQMVFTLRIEVFDRFLALPVLTMIRIVLGTSSQS